jgi:hypothetical protein
MSTSNLEQVLNKVKALSPDEQQQLLNALNSILQNAPAQMTEDEFEQRMAKRGVISGVKPPITDFEPYKQRKPIEVKGQPISETIIEERR